MAEVLLKVTNVPSIDANHEIAQQVESLLGTDVIISENFVLLANTQNHLQTTDSSALNNNQSERNACVSSLLLPVPIARITLDGHVYSNFLSLLTYSKKLREKFLQRMEKCQRFSCISEESECNKVQNTCSLCILEITVVWPAKLSIDYNWNYKVKELIYEYSELENLSAWLSTLGGAFSSLGEMSSQFADKAQITSVYQWKIANQLNNPLLMSRCRLFYAISLLQKNELKKARRIIENEYKFAKSENGRLDFRLKNMCLGIWAKLRYHHQQRHKKTNTLDIS